MRPEKGVRHPHHNVLITFSPNPTPRYPPAMPDPYRRRRPHLKEDILAWVEAGTSLARICAQPDMPADITVRAWRRTDESFDQRLAQALVVGAHRRRWTFDPVLAEAFLHRYRHGETLEALYRDPALPGRNQIRRWTHLHPPFGEEIGRVKRINAAVRRETRPSPRVARPYDPAIADRLLYRVGQGQHMKTLHRIDPAFPTPKMVARWRKEQSQFDADLRVNLAVGRSRQRHVAARRCAVVADRLLLRVAEGASLAEAVEAPGLPSRRTLGRWLRANPDFARRMRLACAHRDAWLIDQLQVLAERAVPGTVKEVKAMMAPISQRLGRMRRPG